MSRKKKLTLKRVSQNLTILRRRADVTEKEFKEEFARLNEWVQQAGTSAMGLDQDLGSLVKMYYAANVHRNIADEIEKTN